MRPKQSWTVDRIRFACLVLLGVCRGEGLAYGETKLTPWGVVAGQRVKDEWVTFEAGVRWVHPGWSGYSTAVKYLQRPKYTRTNDCATVSSAVDGVEVRQVVTDTGKGSVHLDLQLSARTNAAWEGGYYCFDLPPETIPVAAVDFLDVETGGREHGAKLRLAETDRGERGRRRARGVRVGEGRQRWEIRWSEPREVVVRREASDPATMLNDPSVRRRLVSPAAGERVGTQIYVEIFRGATVEGQTARCSLDWTLRHRPETGAVRLVIEPDRPGEVFRGIGGNFRRQFPATDGAVMAYNLEALPVAWGRVDLPWAEWHAERSESPLALARAGRLHERVQAALETVRTLRRTGAEVIVSVWTAPRWAWARVQVPGQRGVTLDGEQMEAMCRSLADYLEYVREQVGREPGYVSFNEPETGVDVRQTGREHAAFLGRLGAELERRGLSTRCLAGDTAHGTAAALAFVGPVLVDGAARRATGGLAFHTWRGCRPEVLGQWLEVARGMGVPLLVTEAGPDAHLHEYPAVRLEPWFQLESIELYVRCLAYAQPAAVLEWQLTSDYSVLAGGGVYGEPGPLRPTTRFWHLKQLGLTPRGARWLPVRSDGGEGTCAAFGEERSGLYGIHVVNSGAARPVVIAGIPTGRWAWRQWVTDERRGMEAVARGRVSRGEFRGWLPAGGLSTWCWTPEIGAGSAAIEEGSK